MEMEREKTKHHKHIDMVTFRNIPHSIQREMAKHLDTNAEANWEALADWHGVSSVDIQVTLIIYYII